jgi:hypothetical protein
LSLKGAELSQPMAPPKSGKAPSSAKVTFAVAATGFSESKIMKPPMNTVTLTAQRIQRKDPKEHFMAETP